MSDVGINPALCSSTAQHANWVVSNSHPSASPHEITTLTQILDIEWDKGIDWHDYPDELEMNVRDALRYGGDQVSVVVGDIFCQGMNKFATLRREGTSVTTVWPASLKLQSDKCTAI